MFTPCEELLYVGNSVSVVRVFRVKHTPEPTMASYTPVKLAFNTLNPESGASEKSPIIFAHGLTASKEHWDAITQTVANATKRKVYAIDARNHGDSEWSDVFNFDCIVDDILHFMDTEGIPKAIVVGHSMGGITGIKASLRSPDRIEKLIVEDMNVQKLPQELFTLMPVFFELAKTALRQVPDGVDEATAKKTIIQFIMNNLPKDPVMEKLVNSKSVDDNIPLQLRPTEDGRFAYKANYIAIENSLKNASKLTSDYDGVYEGPAFFIYGTLSPFQVGSDEPNIRKFFPNAELLGIENATHSVHTDYPQQFTDAVISFILKE